LDRPESFVNRRLLLPFISAVARDVYADLAAMEDEIRRSTTQWTIVRRADVAHVMLKMLDDPATVKQAVGIAY
jgi:hypothetical protein